MSYEAWGELDDPPELPEDCIDGDTAEELRTLLKQVCWENTPGDRSAAALTLIDHILNPPKSGQPDDPHVVWAKTLLKDIL